MSRAVVEGLLIAGIVIAFGLVIELLRRAGRRNPYHTLEEMMIAPMPYRPVWPPTIGTLANVRREEPVTRPDHTIQLQALLECLKDICIAMDAHRWADIAPHPSTDRTRSFLLSTARLVECFPDNPRRGTYLAHESELVKAARTARRVLVDPIPEVSPVLDRIRETLTEMGGMVR